MDKISFGNTLHFLQKQVGLPCIYCGRRILAESELKAMSKKIPGLKGTKLAEFLYPYADCFESAAKREPLDSLISHACEEEFASEGLKGLALRFTDFYNNQPLDILRRVFDSVLYSTEHVLPHSNGGANRHFNYLPMHRGCNSGRFSEDYTTIAQNNPDFVKNIEKTLKEIRRRITADRSSKKPVYKIQLEPSYIDDISESLKQQGISVNMDFIKNG